MRPRFSLATRSLNLPLRVALRTASLMPGVEAVRIDARHELKFREMSQTGKRELLHFLRENGLQLSAISYSVRHAFYDPTALDQRLSATREAMDLAALLNVRHLCVKIGTIPAEESSPQFTLLRETISDLARHGNRVGVTLTIVPGGESPDLLQNFMSQIHTGPLAVDFDPARMLLGGLSPAQMLRSLNTCVEQFTARDAVRDFSGGVEETPLGRGEVVWDELLATLTEIDYRGWITIQRNSGEGQQADLERSVQYLENILGEF